MEEIEIGEYVRTKEGFIAKSIYRDADNNLYFNDFIMKMLNTKFKFLNKLEQKEKIKKHNKNIIELLEVGDFVNGFRILAMKDSIYENSKRILIYKNQKELYERWIYIQEHDGKIHTQDDIAEILTKEQYEANCFRLEEI